MFTVRISERQSLVLSACIVDQQQSSTHTRGCVCSTNESGRGGLAGGSAGMPWCHEAGRKWRRACWAGRNCDWAKRSYVKTLRINQCLGRRGKVGRKAVPSNSPDISDENVFGVRKLLKPVARLDQRIRRTMILLMLLSRPLLRSCLHVEEPLHWPPHRRTPRREPVLHGFETWWSDLPDRFPMSCDSSLGMLDTLFKAA